MTGCVRKPSLKSRNLPEQVGFSDHEIFKRTGIARQYLRFAEQQGLVVRSGRGLYVPADAAVTEFHTFAEAAKRAPRGIICLLSALRFHNIGTQNPFEVWMAIGEKDRRPRSDHPRIRIVRFSKQSLEFGQETHKIEGVPTRVFSLAKTVADHLHAMRSYSI